MSADFPSDESKKVLPIKFVACYDSMHGKDEVVMSDNNLGFESARDRRAAMSRHADKRAQQRGIDKAALPLLLAYGQREFDGRGGIRYLMTADALDSLRRAVGRTKQVEALAGVYVVVSADDQTVITMGHRHN